MTAGLMVMAMLGTVMELLDSEARFPEDSEAVLERARRQLRLISGAVAAAGYRVTRASISYTDELALDQVTGGIRSALQAGQLPPPGQRPQFAEQIRSALARHPPYTGHVEVSPVLGTASILAICLSAARHPVTSLASSRRGRRGSPRCRFCPELRKAAR